MILSGLSRPVLLLSLAGLTGALTACSVEGTTSAGEQQIVVDKATIAIQDLFVGTTPTSRSRQLLAQARAVMICPSVLDMSFGIGGSGGRCVLLTRDARGSWSDPAFYRLGAGSLGVQVGVQNAERVFFVMSQRGIQALLDSQFKFDAGASASFASIGSGVERSSAGVRNTDIYAAEKDKGLYAGAALGGSKLTVDSGANRAYYNQYVGPEDIIIAMRVNNPAADPLRRMMMSLSRQPVQMQPEYGNAVSPARGASYGVTGSASPAGYQAAAQGAAEGEVGNNPYAGYNAAARGVQSQSLPR